MKNIRLIYLLLSISTILLGLGSRRYGTWLPGWVAAYAGDTLWALLVYWLLGLGWSSRTAKWRAAAAIIFSFLIEVSQLYHPAWLEAARNTTLGSLVLGHGFLWSDLMCYTSGVLIGYMADRWLITKQLKPILQR